MGWPVGIRRDWGSGGRPRHYSNRNRRWNHYFRWRQRGGFRSGQRESKEWRKKDEVITIFVDNLDPRVSIETMKELFTPFGEVSDIYISRKYRGTNPNHFGFVKMKGPARAFRAIRILRGKWIYNSKIFVKEARFKKETKDRVGRKANDVWKSSGSRPLDGEWRARRNQQNEAEDELKPIDEDKFIKAKINPSILEELERSLIGESDEPRSVEVLSQALTSQWFSISKVRDLGPYKFIITFSSKDDMVHAVETKNPLLLQHFSQISPWDFYQQGDTRRIWVEVMGIPPQVWSRETCETIASKFGTLVCLDSSSENPDSFVTCRMMVDTNVMSYISEVLYISIEEQCIGKSIYVREGSNLTTCYIKQPGVNRFSSSFQWDDSMPSRNVNIVDSNEEGDAVGVDNVAASGVGVQVTPVSRECIAETEESVTHIGNVMYDINEEKELIAMRKSNTNFDNSFVPLSSEEDCPPGFLRIGRNKGKKRGDSHQLLKNSNIGVRKKRVKSKARNQLLLNEITDGVELGSTDSIEPWSEDDYESDPELESRKSRELGVLLGLGGGKQLNIEELLN